MGRAEPREPRLDLGREEEDRTDEDLEVAVGPYGISASDAVTPPPATVAAGDAPLTVASGVGPGVVSGAGEVGLEARSRDNAFF